VVARAVRTAAVTAALVVQNALLLRLYVPTMATGAAEVPTTSLGVPPVQVAAVPVPVYATVHRWTQTLRPLVVSVVSTFGLVGVPAVTDVTN
jgi:hypothetical protein